MIVARSWRKPPPRRLLQQLLEYIEEQAKEIDPRGFTLAAAKGFNRRSEELVGLPGCITSTGEAIS
jgi:hypothetical protein